MSHHRSWLCTSESCMVNKLLVVVVVVSCYMRLSSGHGLRLAERPKTNIPLRNAFATHLQLCYDVINIVPHKQRCVYLRYIHENWCIYVTFTKQLKMSNTAMTGQKWNDWSSLNMKKCIFGYYDSSTSCSTSVLVLIIANPILLAGVTLELFNR